MITKIDFPLEMFLLATSSTFLLFNWLLYGAHFLLINFFLSQSNHFECACLIIHFHIGHTYNYVTTMTAPFPSMISRWKLIYSTSSRNKMLEWISLELISTCNTPIFCIFGISQKYRNLLYTYYMRWRHSTFSKILHK